MDSDLRDLLIKLIASIDKLSDSMAVTAKATTQAQTQATVAAGTKTTGIAGTASDTGDGRLGAGDVLLGASGLNRYKNMTGAGMGIQAGIDAVTLMAKAGLESSYWKNTQTKPLADLESYAQEAGRAGVKLTRQDLEEIVKQRVGLGKLEQENISTLRRMQGLPAQSKIEGLKDTIGENLDYAIRKPGNFLKDTWTIIKDQFGYRDAAIQNQKINGSKTDGL